MRELHYYHYDSKAEQNDRTEEAFSPNFALKIRI